MNIDVTRSHITMPLGFGMKRQTDVTTVHDCSSHVCVGVWCNWPPTNATNYLPMPSSCSGYSPSEPAGPDTLSCNLIKWLRLFAGLWWTGTASPYSSVDGLRMYSCWELSGMGPRVLDISDEAWENQPSSEGLRLPQRSLNFEIVSSPDRLWNPAMQAAGCAAVASTPAPFQSLSFHGHGDSVLNVPETAAPVLEHFTDWYWVFLLWQRHAIVCTRLHIWYLAAFVGIPHKD